MKILIISGSPQKNGNTAALVEWFCEGARAAGAELSVVRAAELSAKVNGCCSCRICQKRPDYGCVLADDVSALTRRIAETDILVMATPLYFFALSAQLKIVLDRMFSLYKWDNAANTMQTCLNGKKLVVLASAYEDVGLENLEKPFKFTADYSRMTYDSLLIPDAGVSGEITKIPGIKDRVTAFAAHHCRSSDC